MTVNLLDIDREPSDAALRFIMREVRDEALRKKAITKQALYQQIKDQTREACLRFGVRVPRNAQIQA